MDDRTRKLLSQYLSDVKRLPNEAAKTSRFSSLIGELFPGSKAVARVASGMESVVWIETPEGERPRRIDTYYGNAAIEFEKSLDATEAKALSQLREQVSGVWRKEGMSERPLLAVASDGINWKSFRPSSSVRSPSPDDVELSPLRQFTVTEDSLRDFWIWLTSFLFRDGQIVPTAERFKVDFGANSLAYNEIREVLDESWAAVREQPEVELQLDTWRRYLTVTYGTLSDSLETQEELEDLFLKHTFLVSIARLLVWAALSEGETSKSLRHVANATLTGEYFRSLNIENLVEEDFFQWVQKDGARQQLEPVWERTITQMLSYDLSALSQDVLKGVYEELIDPKDRHNLGEYYTPEWLCEAIVQQLLPTDRISSVIDPTCGSGSFLRATIDHLLDANESDDRAERLHAVLENVVGIDIHPVAVTIAKATYVLTIRNLVQSARRPVQIPVYLADSLFLPTEVEQYELGEEPAYEITFGSDRTVRINEELVEDSEAFDRSIQACARVAADHAESDQETRESLAVYLKKAAPQTNRFEEGDIIDGLWEFTEELASLIRERQNSIWAFVVRNGYRPAMLQGKFDYVVGNPPWLSYRYIEDPDYQKEVKKRAVIDYGVAPKSSKLTTQMELATVFLVHTLRTFGNEDSRLGFVMPRSILSADQHAKLRERRYVAPMTITEYWDLWGVSPLFNVPACAVFAERRQPRLETSYELPAVEWKGKLPDRNCSLVDADPHLSRAKQTATLIYLAERSALSTQPGKRRPTRGSKYREEFRQGATLVPRNLFFVQVRDVEGVIDPDRLYWIETEPEQARRAKPPYDDIHMEGKVAGRFLFKTILSRNLLPFRTRDLPWAVLPVEKTNGELSMCTAAQARAAGYRDAADWFAKAAKLWDEKKTKSAANMSIYERLNYHKELTAQREDHRHLVLYNAAGKHMAAAYVDRKKLPAPFVVEHKLYWAALDTEQEASYLTAVLNSREVNQAIKPFQSTGLLGQRDIEKKVLDVNIPIFSSSKSIHMELAELGSSAQQEVTEYLEDHDPPGRLGRQRRHVREILSERLSTIDKLVREIVY